MKWSLSKTYELCGSNPKKLVQLKKVNLNNLMTSRQNPIGSKSDERFRIRITRAQAQTVHLQNKVRKSQRSQRSKVK